MKFYRLLLICLIVAIIFTLKQEQYYENMIHGPNYEFQFKRTYKKQIYSGRPFKSELNKYLAKFNLLNVPNDIDEKLILESDPVIVSAFSSSHFRNGLTMLNYLSSRFKNTKKVYVYNLGLLSEERDKLLTEFNHTIFELRTFAFGDYPKFVRNLNAFHWKPLIIAEMLNEFPSIWWFDTSVQMRRHADHIYNEYKSCSTNRSTCAHYPWLFIDHGGHSIYAATNPKMYEYLPMPLTWAKKLNMVGANLQLIYGLKEIKEKVLRYWVLCALEEECMAPPQSFLVCGNGDRYDEYLGCHRYDQSAINILVAWTNHFKEARYRHFPNTAFEIVRY